MPVQFNLQCPVPRPADDHVVLAHGGGGALTRRLLESVFLPAFSNSALNLLHDGAPLEIAGGKLAFTTDSYVVHPLIFPGGTIGDLAVNGTVNDLAMCGARPLYLSAAFILEEGLPLATLRTVVDSMAAAAQKAGILIVTGDTKVVDKGKGDGVFITTSGVGAVQHSFTGPARIQPGDAVIVNGDLASHGLAILSVREGLEFDAPFSSDTCPLWEPVERLFHAGIDVHCLRDLTRGGLSSALNELAGTRGVRIHLDEASIPVREAVRGACEFLGLDPLYVANEGRFVAFVPDSQATEVLRLLPGAERIGSVLASDEPLVTLRSSIGGTRVLDMLSGEQLPRIC